MVNFLAITVWVSLGHCSLLPIELKFHSSECFALHKYQYIECIRFINSYILFLLNKTACNQVIWVRGDPTLHKFFINFTLLEICIYVKCLKETIFGVLNQECDLILLNLYWKLELVSSKYLPVESQQ